MALLHVVQYSLPDLQTGYTVRTQAVLRVQQASGLTPLLLTSPRHPSAQETEVEGVPHYRCPPEATGGSPWRRDQARVLALSRRIEEIAARRGDVRLLHAHSPVLCGLAALRAGRRLGLPVVYEVRGLWEEAMRRKGPAYRWWLRYRLAQVMETRVARAAAAVVAISEGLRAEFVGRGVLAEKVHVVGNGVDLRLFQPRPADTGWRAARGLTEGPLLLYLGALRAYEGVDLLLSAFPAIRREHPAAQLLIVGDGETRQEVEAAARGIDGLSVVPPLPHAEVADCYAAADLVVYPRRSDRATERVTPLKPLEAMAMAKAIVSSDVGGMRELLVDGETARLFAAGSAPELALACGQLLASPETRARLGAQAREAAVARFDWREVVARYGPVYAAAGLRPDGGEPA